MRQNPQLSALSSQLSALSPKLLLHRARRPLAAIIAATVVLAACASTPRQAVSVGAAAESEAVGCRIQHDWRPILHSTDPACGSLTAAAKAGVLINERAAMDRAIIASGQGDMRTGWMITALLRITRADPALGQPGDFVWEIRVTNSAVEGGTQGLIWINAKTGRAKVLF